MEEKGIMNMRKSFMKNIIPLFFLIFYLLIIAEAIFSRVIEYLSCELDHFSNAHSIYIAYGYAHYKRERDT